MSQALGPTYTTICPLQKNATSPVKDDRPAQIFVAFHLFIHPILVNLQPEFVVILGEVETEEFSPALKKRV